MLLVIARGLFVACALSGFGAALFALTMPIARHVDARLHASIERQVRKIISLSLAAALVVGYAWLPLETHAVASTTNLAQTVTAIPTVLFDTRFGQVLAAGYCHCVRAGCETARAEHLAASLAGPAVMLEAGHSRAFAMAHIPLLLSQMLHLTAAGAWLGGLLPLLIVVREAPLEAAQRAARHFSTLGTISVSVLAATALFQGTLLSGALTGLTGTAYGAVLLLKAVLFAPLISIAAVNRFRLTPAFAGPDAEKARRALALTIGIETVVGLCVVFAASLLSSLEPGMHMETHGQ
jgi:copper resistance protein D